MARREVLTIGYMRSGGRYGARTRSLRAIGQTETGYVVPSLDQLDATPPGAALTAAMRAMLGHFASSGVPSEHDDDPYVRSMQEAYVADPLSKTTAGPALSVDGGYGPNTEATAAVLVDYTGGGTVPAVNTGASTVTPPSTVTPSTPTKPAVTPSTPTKPAAAGGSSPWPWVLGIGGALIVLLIIAKKRKRKGGHASAPGVIIKANPFKRAHPRHAGMR